MAKGIHKGTELSNVSETWDQNERNRPAGAAGRGDDGAATTSGGGEIERVIQEEAAEYDAVNKEDRLMSGERASVRDEDDPDTSNE